MACPKVERGSGKNEVEWTGSIEFSVVELLAASRVQELCESRGGRPELPVLMSLTVSVGGKQH